ncbi:MAG: FlgD immunoglobulin-like domain containing protein [Candidatus Poribacteria bacterium]
MQVTVKTTVQDAAGNTLERDFTFSFTTGFGVWPGDTNNDGSVNLLDIIPIARHWNQPGGIPRETPQAVEWAVQPVAPWSVKPATYVDANGDGLINEQDIIPIAENWLRSRNLPPPAAPNGATELNVIDNLELYQRMLNALDRYGVVTKGTLALRSWLTQRIATLRRQHIPDQTKLLPNYPNPFNPETWIPYQLAEVATVQIEIYDLKGKQVRMLDVGQKPAGYYIERNKAAYWDGRNNLGEPLASGIYIYHLVARDYTQTRRMVIVK